ncbi:hypothetical protein BGZ94_005173 [Podila epigama]|nr:hypothetical protein BGZ94_005173 [Podila epigama]
MSSQDYRVSTIVVLCKDCGNDVGAYPGRHKCSPADRPPMPAMPSIPSKYQQSPSSFPTSSYSSSHGANGRMRPPDLNAQQANSYGSNGSYGGSNSRTPTSSSFQDRMANGGRTPTASSFQERMKERDREKQQREREEREAAARALREDPRVNASSATSTSTTSATSTTAGTGQTLWNRLLAAKEVINATITGEEKWPDSDDSDYEGETHVARILRERLDKKEEAEMAAKIAELEMNPYSGNSNSGSLSKASGRNQYLRDASSKREPAPSIASSTSSGDDPYSRSLRARGIDTISHGSDPDRSNNTYGSNSLNSGAGNRYRTTSDASRDDALSRLEGKSDGGKLNTQISHLGSTSPRVRANSPNVGFRPDPAAQQHYHQQLSPSSANNYNSNNNNSHYHSSSSSSLSSQRAVSPSNHRYDSPSPSPSASSSRYAPAQSSSPSYRHQQPAYSSSPVSSSASLRSDAYGSRGQGQGLPPSSSPGRPEYERRPTFPPTTGQPPVNNNLGAYGQRQQYQQYQQQSSSSYANNGYF